MMESSLFRFLSCTPSPSFIYLHHPHHPSTSLPPLPSDGAIAKLDAVEHNTPRLLLSGILNKLGQEEEVNTFDGFAIRLRSWWNDRSHRGKGKGKSKTKINGHTSGYDGYDVDEEQVIIMITKAERLRLVLGNGWSIITRLAELTGVPITVVLCSSSPWDHVRPIRGDAFEPVHIYLPPPSKEEILSELLPCSRHPLWPRFLDLLLSTILPICSPPTSEIHYISMSLWPIYTANLPPHSSMNHLNLSYPKSSVNPPRELDITIKLLTDLKHQLSLSLAASIENLLPRLTGTHEFKNALLPRVRSTRTLPKPPSMELSLVEKFLLIAGYAGSYNPPKSDIRLFGRGAGEHGKRKKGGGTRRAGYGRTRIGKVPQRLLGPKPFPIDRLLSLFSSLYAEHASRPEDLQAALGGESSSEEDEFDWLPTVAEQAAKVEKKRKRESEREKQWDENVDELAMSTKLWGLIPQLESQGLMKRISPSDRLDNIMLRCEIDYETAKSIAKELKITLDEYLYEASM
ncbi:uncharacterized protein IL334_003367 [Kwoniella shivajii]|uniref:Origin recognition complex subunit 5 C-terminal domain-containing protein n=1 Tax=Kwoniella shivajii TaxID=564305 RepID=A0ABZ1D0C2_9TREE|nr:hypothetical protein IL334_003367 [Kwoniella shivajii]